MKGEVASRRTARVGVRIPCGDAKIGFSLFGIRAKRSTSPAFARTPCPNFALQLPPRDTSGLDVLPSYPGCARSAHDNSWRRVRTCATLEASIALHTSPSGSCLRNTFTLRSEQQEAERAPTLPRAWLLVLLVARRELRLVYALLLMVCTRTRNLLSHLFL